MIPKKLFTPKCLHIDREVVFKEDFDNFFQFLLMKIKQILLCFDKVFDPNETSEENLIENFNFKFFKSQWIEKKMSMLHFCKSKEENLKEYYEVLFGEVQNYFFFNDKKLSLLFKIFSIFTLYSLYFTQTTEYFYQINTTAEVLAEINQTLKLLKKMKNKKLVEEIAMMTKRLYDCEAFSLGVISGLKSIILNKYGLPLEQKQKVYKEYMEINSSIKTLHSGKSEESEKLKLFKHNLEDYTDLKRETVNLIKEVEGESFINSYCEFMKEANKETKSYDLIEIKVEDFKQNKVTNMDLQFNQIDSNIFNA
jgi:hypothetical protein